MKYEEIDEDVRIQFEILYLKTLLAHKSVREKFMEEIEVAEDVFDDIQRSEQKFPKAFGEGELQVYIGMLNRMVLLAKDNSELQSIIETGRDKCLADLKRKRDYREFNEILDSDEIEAEDEKVLTKVANCCPYYATSSLELIQLIVLDIDRTVRNAKSYRGSYVLDVAIAEMHSAIKERTEKKYNISLFEIREAVLQCIECMYNSRKGHNIVRLFSFTTEEHIFDIIL